GNDGGKFFPYLRKKFFYRAGRRHAGRVADRDVLHAEPGELAGVLEHTGRINPAFEWTAEGDRHGADHAEAAFGRLHHVCDVLPLLGPAAVKVFLRVRFRGGDEEADLVRAMARVEVGEGPLDRMDVGAGRLV